jgi:hypothetical protein
MQANGPSRHDPAWRGHVMIVVSAMITIAEGKAV